MAEEEGIEIELEELRKDLEQMPQVPLTFLKAAKILGLNIITSMPLMSGFILQYNLPKEVFKSRFNSTRHLNFVKSIPSEAIISTLVGMKSPSNVEQNLESIYNKPISRDEFFDYVMSLQQPNYGQNGEENFR